MQSGKNIIKDIFVFMAAFQRKRLAQNCLNNVSAMNVFRGEHTVPLAGLE